MQNQPQNKPADPPASAERPKATGLLPDFYADKVSDIDFAVLRRRGVRYLVLDVDHTLAVYNALELDPETIGFLRQLRQDGDVQEICIASNSRRNLRPMAESIGARIVRPGRWQRKPSRGFYRRLLQELDCRPDEAVMVGDKMFNDVWGGNRVGMYTVLVRPIGPDMWLDRLLLRRYLGERYLRRRGGRRAS